MDALHHLRSPGMMTRLQIPQSGAEFRPSIGQKNVSNDLLLIFPQLRPVPTPTPSASSRTAAEQPQRQSEWVGERREADSADSARSDVSKEGGLTANAFFFGGVAFLRRSQPRKTHSFQPG